MSIVKLERKAHDTREVVYFLGCPDFTGDQNPLTGAVVTITIWHPDGGIIQQGADCVVLELKTDENGVQGADVAYYPEPDDFDDLGTYSLQWLATYPNGTTARFPSAKRAPDGPFALVVVGEDLDSRAVA